MARTQATTDKTRFEDALKRLEGVVERLEEGEIPLEEALRLFEEGVKLSRLCHQRLDEAEKRVDQAYTDAVSSLETARKATVLAGLVTATALLVGLLAAWFAAQNGGRHRDENLPARLIMAWTPRPRRPLP